MYTVLPRPHIGCLATNEDDLLTQLAAVLAVGSKALWEGAMAARLHAQLPMAVQQRVEILAAGVLQAPRLDAVLQHGTATQLQASCEALALRPGAIVSVQGLAPGEADIALDRLVLERSLSVNTAAAGGNASLMTIG